MRSKPLVSACIITYNHEAFIAECLEGALKQELDYSYEIVIGEDFSTDNTLTICKTYKEKYPDKIRLVKRDENLGMNGNWAETINACNGKYIAICEGDDYWCDPKKLQKQVDFLETNNLYSSCFGNAVVKDEYSKTEDLNVDQNNQDIYELSDLLKGKNFIVTCTIMFRNNLFDYSKMNDRLPFVDYYIHLSNAQFGKVKYFNEVFGVYRINENGVHGGFFKSKKGLLQSAIKHHQFWSIILKEDHFDTSKVKSNIKKSIARTLMAAISAKDYKTFFKFNNKLFRYNKFLYFRNFGTLIKSGLLR